ncbi:hypothetical protein [Roseivirga seohaensis]|uniref:hypothetical protein n=1 Tax=Roseivirga seohaensis TaxID=1914963 RepID=UPI003BAA9005
MLRLIEYNSDYYEKWNKFIISSSNGTFFNRLDFLSYHKDKFKEGENHLIWLKGEAIFAVMPLFVGYQDGIKIATSPYGASFGGPTYDSRLNLKYALEMVDTLIEYLMNQSVSKINLTLPPLYYSERSDQNIEFALLKAGFRICSTEVMSVVELKNTVEEIWTHNLSGRARTSIRKINSEFEVFKDCDISDFYPILLEDKARHSNSVPTHTLEQLTLLKCTFPNKIYVDIAVHKEGGKAGICYFQPNKNVILTFYMAQDNLGKGLDGKSLLVYEGMKDAVSKGIRYFDFGSSTIGYNIQNIGVASFKESFGAKTRLKLTYSLIQND